MAYLKRMKIWIALMGILLTLPTLAQTGQQIITG